VELHFGPQGLKIFFELLTVLMIHTIKQLFNEIMLLAGFLNQLMKMLMILEARINNRFSSR
jgi:hypothetical protein